MANLRMAWTVGLGNKDREPIVRGLETLMQFAEITGKYLELENFTNEVLQTLDCKNPTDLPVIGAALVCRGGANYRSGDYNSIMQDCNEAIKHLMPPNNTSRNGPLWLANQILGVRHWSSGDAQNARQAHSTALHIAKTDFENAKSNRANSKHAMMRMGVSYHNLGLVELYYDEHDSQSAEQYLSMSKQKNSEIGSPYVCYSYLYLGEYYLFKGRLVNAKNELYTGKEIAESINYGQ